MQKLASALTKEKPVRGLDNVGFIAVSRLTFPGSNLGLSSPASRLVACRER
jgi:hypothetical protein